jgi:hypothetical protein
MRLDEDRAMLDRLHERLTEALQQRADPYGAPVTVAEIYQELVPYRAVRGEVGFAMNADYEHALLRLLSGEGERVRLEPASARDVIVHELRSPNPNVSVYREYAACEVWVTPRALSESPASAGAPLAGAGDDDLWADLRGPAAAGGDADTGAATPFMLELTEDDEVEAPLEGAADLRQNGAAQSAQEAVAREGTEPPAGAEASTAPAPAGGAEAAAAAPGDRPAEQRARRTSASLDSAQAAAARYAAARQAIVPDVAPAANCGFCDSQLPPGRRARFCPFCGGDQTMKPCQDCGEALEAGWLFCIACGAPAESR